MNNELESNGEAERQQTVAAAIKETPYFTGTSEGGRLQDKQLLFLVVSGLKPAAFITSGHMEKTQTGSISVADDEVEVRLFLDSLGVAYSIESDEHALDTTVARTQDELHAAVYAWSGMEIGRALGFPETALTDDFDTAMLPEESKQLALRTYGDPKFADFLFFLLSKQHALQELETAKLWYDTVKKYGLID